MCWIMFLLVMYTFCLFLTLQQMGGGPGTNRGIYFWRGQKCINVIIFNEKFKQVKIDKKLLESDWGVIPFRLHLDPP